ncbi:oxidoreductase [Arachidicoccus ginsenosidimutans]|uniref:NADH:flavin oxidoreductase/NADH oxidase n=1 Tax=Arachidicoccus sp. BS20 TaxID=1850526 RepID=UPI0007F1686F|nr:NADH:flavin oxidoreductase/NADH oxidase [Arachidicoccus sp. BS20]ANI90180.1 oxidoreductase [Arachidicoccus sp. BS20]
MPHLFSPLQIKNIELKNRIAVAPMCQYSAEDGFATTWHTVHYGNYALGGAALITFEATAVSPEGRITPWDLGIWKNEHIEGLKKIVDFIHEYDSVAGVQLAHAGRKASHLRPWEGGAQIASNQPNGWKTVAPSAIPFLETEEAPLELDLAGIEKVKADFKAAAQRAKEAGFKVIMIHAAHGYLLHEFMSPLSNRRTDEYGGSFENRIRLLLEVIENVQSVWAENPLLVRMSSTEWTEGGWNKDDSVALAQILKNKGVDLIDCSGGGNVPRANIPVGPGYQVEYAEAVRKTGILTGAVGLITGVEQANKIIETGQADIISLARQLIRDPFFPLRAAHELGYEVKWASQYERGKW